MLERLDTFLDFLNGDSGGPLWSGEHVSTTSAQHLSTIYRCISLIAETAASLPFHVYRRDGDDDRVPYRSHALYPLIHDFSSPGVSAIHTREALTRDAITTGNGYAWVERNGAMKPAALWRMPPQQTQRILETLKDGSTRDRYLWTPSSGEPIPFDPKDILHVMGPSENGFTGLSVIQKYAANSVGTSTAARRFGGQFFRRGARATGLLSAPSKLSDAARHNLKESFKLQLEGENRLGLLLVEEGIKFDQLTIPPEDAQFLETLDYSDHESCRWFGVPPVLAGVTSKTTSWGSGIEHLTIGFLQYTMLVWLRRWETAVNRVITGGNVAATDIYAEHDVSGLLRGDLKTQTLSIDRLWTSGVITQNEARRRLGFAGVANGDVYSLPVNKVLIDGNGKLFAGGQGNDEGGSGADADTTQNAE